jgi:hypothetical protein
MFAIFRRSSDPQLELLVPVVDKDGHFTASKFDTDNTTLASMQNYKVLLGTKIAQRIGFNAGVYKRTVHK